MVIRATILTVVLAARLAAIPPTPGKAIEGPIAEGSKVTYAELLRLVCPDLKVEDEDAVTATATTVIGIRELGKNVAPQPTEGELEVESVRTVAILKTARPRVLVSLAMGGEDDDGAIRKLALFELTPVPRQVDIVGLPAFPDDAGDIESRFALNPTSDGYEFDAYHSNSTQGYQFSTLVFVPGDRIEKIADVALLSSHSYEDVQEFEESLKISTVPDVGQPYRSVVVRVTLKRLADDPEREYRPLRRATTHVYSALYRWDAAAGRFATTSRELDVLDANNRKQY